MKFEYQIVSNDRLTRGSDMILVLVFAFILIIVPKGAIGQPTECSVPIEIVYRGNVYSDIAEMYLLASRFAKMGKFERASGFADLARLRYQVEGGELAPLPSVQSEQDNLSAVNARPVEWAREIVSRQARLIRQTESYIQCPVTFMRYVDALSLRHEEYKTDNADRDPLEFALCRLVIAPHWPDMAAFEVLVGLTTELAGRIARSNPDLSTWAIEMLISHISRSKLDPAYIVAGMNSLIGSLGSDGDATLINRALMVASERVPEIELYQADKTGPARDKPQPKRAAVLLQIIDTLIWIQSFDNVETILRMAKQEMRTGYRTDPSVRSDLSKRAERLACFQSGKINC